MAVEPSRQSKCDQIGDLQNTGFVLRAEKRLLYDPRERHITLYPWRCLPSDMRIAKDSIPLLGVRTHSRGIFRDDRSEFVLRAHASKDILEMDRAQPKGQ